MWDIFKDWLDRISQIDEKLGLKKILAYIAIIIFVIFLFNWKTIMKDMIEVWSDIENEIHNEKIELRDQLLTEMYPILGEFRSDVRADRILYFEYHNSKENLLSIPFKYIDLVQQNSKYSVPSALEDKFRDINTGLITPIYDDIKVGNIVYCSGPNDTSFQNKYPGVYEWISEQDGSRRHIYLSIPGINQPVGMIVLEWINESNEDPNLEEIERIANQNYIPRINALIISKSRSR